MFLIDHILNFNISKTYYTILLKSLKKNLNLAKLINFGWANSSFILLSFLQKTQWLNLSFFLIGFWPILMDLFKFKYRLEPKNVLKIRLKFKQL